MAEAKLTSAPEKSFTLEEIIDFGKNLNFDDFSGIYSPTDSNNTEDLGAFIHDAFLDSEFFQILQHTTDDQAFLSMLSCFETAFQSSYERLYTGTEDSSQATSDWCDHLTELIILNRMQISAGMDPEEEDFASSLLELVKMNRIKISTTVKERPVSVLEGLTGKETAEFMLTL